MWRRTPLFKLFLFCSVLSFLPLVAPTKNMPLFTWFHGLLSSSSSKAFAIRQKHFNGYSFYCLLLLRLATGPFRAEFRPRGASWLGTASVGWVNQMGRFCAITAFVLNDDYGARIRNWNYIFVHVRSDEQVELLSKESIRNRPGDGCKISGKRDGGWFYLRDLTLVNFLPNTVILLRTGFAWFLSPYLGRVKRDN